MYNIFKIKIIDFSEWTQYLILQIIHQFKELSIRIKRFWKCI